METIHPSRKRKASELVPYISDTSQDVIFPSNPNDSSGPSKRIYKRGALAMKKQHEDSSRRLAFSIMGKIFKDIRFVSIPDFDFSSFISGLNSVSTKSLEADYKATWSARTDLMVFNEHVVLKAGEDALACLLKGTAGARNKTMSDHIVHFSNTYRPKYSKYDFVKCDLGGKKSSPTQRVTYYINSGEVALGAKTRLPIPSATMIHSQTALNENVELLHHLHFTSYLTNAAFSFLDNKLYQEYEALRKSPHLSLASQMFLTQCPSVWLGKTILINEHTEWHRHVGDRRDGWCAIVYFGDFTHGDMFLPDLNVRLVLAPGDIVFIRSFALAHFIDNWVGDGRYVVVYYTGGSCFPTL